MRQLEGENLRLKKLVADLSLDKAMLQDVPGRTLKVNGALCRDAYISSGLNIIEQVQLRATCWGEIVQHTTCLCIMVLIHP